MSVRHCRGTVSSEPASWWHKAAAVTVAAELFTAPELSVSLCSEGGGSAAVPALGSLPLTWGSSWGVNEANTDCCHNSSKVLCSEVTLPCFSSVSQQSSEMQFCSQNVGVSLGQWPLTLLTAQFYHCPVLTGSFLTFHDSRPSGFPCWRP